MTPSTAASIARLPFHNGVGEGTLSGFRPAGLPEPQHLIVVHPGAPQGRVQDDCAAVLNEDFAAGAVDGLIAVVDARDTLALLEQVRRQMMTDAQASRDGDNGMALVVWPAGQYSVMGAFDNGSGNFAQFALSEALAERQTFGRYEAQGLHANTLLEEAGDALVQALYPQPQSRRSFRA